MSSSQPKPFIPPFFSNFGKTNKDLFSKKFDYDNSIKVINRSTAGLTIESGAIQVPSKQLRGYTKVTYVPKERWGKVEGELHTDAAQTSKVSATYDQLANRRARMIVTAATKDKDAIFKKPAVVTTELEYSQDYVSTKVTAKSDTEAHKAEVQGSFGYDNLAIGGIAGVNQQGQLVDTNYGAEYITPTKDLVASVYTEKNATLFNASFLQRITRDQSVGAIFRHDLSGKNPRSLTVGTEYRLDADTDIKVKGELPSGVVSTVIQHQLRNPRVLLGLAASFNTSNNTIAADKFGLSVQLGDF